MTDQGIHTKWSWPTIPKISNYTHCFVLWEGNQNTYIFLLHKHSKEGYYAKDCVMDTSTYTVLKPQKKKKKKKKKIQKFAVNIIYAWQCCSKSNTLCRNSTL